MVERPVPETDKSFFLPIEKSFPGNSCRFRSELYFFFKHTVTTAAGYPNLSSSLWSSQGLTTGRTFKVSVMLIISAAIRTKLAFYKGDIPVIFRLPAFQISGKSSKVGVDNDNQRQCG